MPSRRKFLGQTTTMGLVALTASQVWSAEKASTVSVGELSTLCGKWLPSTPEAPARQVQWSLFARLSIDGGLPCVTVR
jgi:hypothetical protein